MKDLLVALVVAVTLAAGTAGALRYLKERDDRRKVSSTMRAVKMDAASIRDARWDAVRAASLSGGPGGLVDAFRNVGRPNHVTYEEDRITVELRTGAAGSGACITAELHRTFATFEPTSCTPSRD